MEALLNGLNFTISIYAGQGNCQFDFFFSVNLLVCYIVGNRRRKLLKFQDKSTSGYSVNLLNAAQLCA